jgi:transcription elongation factor GreA
MSQDTVPMTPRGHRLLKEELIRLKGPERTKVVRAIEEARAHGDLSENAEYDAAKEAQTQLELRIREVEDRLARANVIDISRLSGPVITFGATVAVLDGDTGDERVYSIVGEDESDIKSGLLSITSPIARSLVGKREGDVVRAKTPSGVRELEIVSVLYGSDFL